MPNSSGGVSHADKGAVYESSVMRSKLNYSGVSQQSMRKAVYGTLVTRLCKEVKVGLRCWCCVVFG